MLAPRVNEIREKYKDRFSVSGLKGVTRTNHESCHCDRGLSLKGVHSEGHSGDL